MSFEGVERIIAVAPQDVAALLTQLRAEHGEYLPDGDRSILTIGAHWDDVGHTRLRAASLADGTLTAQPLTDGRLAFACLWQADIAALLDAGEMPGVEELTRESHASLTAVQFDE